MIYATFEYYKSTFNGEIEDITTFNRLMREASAFLDYISQGRCSDFEDNDNKLKNAACAIVDIRNEYNNGTRGIKSETVGKVSVSYTDTSNKTMESECYQAAKMYLSGTDLLYLGVDRCEQMQI